jgi:hypothetical protein
MEELGPSRLVWSMLRATLTTKLAVAVLEQQKAPLGIGQLDHRIDDGFEHARESEVAVEPLVDAQKAAQAAFEDTGALDASRRPSCGARKSITLASLSDASPGQYLAGVFILTSSKQARAISKAWCCRESPERANSRDARLARRQAMGSRPSVLASTANRDRDSASTVFSSSGDAGSDRSDARAGAGQPFGPGNSGGFLRALDRPCIRCPRPGRECPSLVRRLIAGQATRPARCRRVPPSLAYLDAQRSRPPNDSRARHRARSALALNLCPEQLRVSLEGLDVRHACILFQKTNRARCCVPSPSCKNNCPTLKTASA